MRVGVSDSVETPLRSRLAEVEAAEARRQIEPLPRELASAAHSIRRSARDAERAAAAARRSQFGRPLVMFALGALIAASALALVPGSWKAGSSARRYQALGQRLELVWPSLEDEKKEELRTLLGLSRKVEQEE